MTRIKKNRAGGPLAPRTQEHEGLKPSNALKGKKRGKGKQAGNKQVEAQKARTERQGKNLGDKRVGSKKPISLTATVASAPQTAQSSPKQAAWPPKTEAEKKLALVQLENDAAFMAQVEVLDQGGVLPQAEQKEFETKLQRYDWLIDALGLADDDDEWDDVSEQGKSLKDDWF